MLLEVVVISLFHLRFLPDQGAGAVYVGMHEPIQISSSSVLLLQILTHDHRIQLSYVDLNPILKLSPSRRSLTSPLATQGPHSLNHLVMYGEGQFVNEYIRNSLAHQSDANVIRHFAGFPFLGAPLGLNQATVVCLDIEWWQKEPKPTTELGVAELMVKGMIPLDHAENVLTGIQVAHARIMNNAHLRNNFPGAGDPENFLFGQTKFVTEKEAKEILIRTFVRPRVGGDGSLQPIILVGHAVDNEFDHIKNTFGIDLLSYGSIVSVPLSP